MTLQEFVSKYNGTRVGDGQCVALVKQYEQEVLGLTPQAVGNAHDYYDNFYNQPFLYNNFDRYTYNGTNLPSNGDIIVWSTAVGGGYGHIAIVYQNVTSSNFVSFDQNWNTPLRCKIENHTYRNILGWLRKKGSSPSPEPPDPGPEPPSPTPSFTKKTKFKWVLYARKLRNDKKAK